MLLNSAGMYSFLKLIYGYNLGKPSQDNLAVNCFYWWCTVFESQKEIVIHTRIDDLLLISKKNVKIYFYFSLR